MMNGMTQLPALIKREILEHRNLWKVPLILIGLALLVKASLSFGNLALDFDLPEQLQLDESIDSAVDVVVARALNSMNFIIMLVMFVVGIFYSLSCLFNERQDESVLFWRSLPISDSITVASKLLIGLAVIPGVIIICQTVVAIVFFGTDAFSYLGTYFSGSLSVLGKTLLWSILPVIAWCVFCSEIAQKNPFMLAFVAPIVLILVDKLFLNGVVSQTFVINRLYGITEHTLMALIWGFVFSAVCVVFAVIKRSQRI